MGYSFHDVDDGLALFSLLGDPSLHLLGVTTTYGDGSVQKTTITARRLLDSIGYSDISTIRGAASPDDEPETNQAARYLVDAADKQPSKIVLVATGSMTNLKHAATLDPGFFQKLRGLYLLGGVTEPLIWNKHRLAERNFSLDPEASYLAIHAVCPVTIVTGHAGTTAVFRRSQFAALQTLNDPISRLVTRKVRFWFAMTRLWFQDGGFGMWAPIVALALTHPELLDGEQVRITSTVGDLRTGRLLIDPDEFGPVHLVRGVRDLDGFITAHFAAWHNLGQRVDTRRKKIK
jgi:inosine-uridine nucleoside N-ribohydrolase